ncbi:MAG: alpha/beta hydrolase [Treponema sp.]|nr:alpha/beta hydrolase [Treponema sp.]
MAFSTVPYDGKSPMGFVPMKPWPSLADKAFCLIDESRPGESLFFFDSLPDSKTPGATPPVVVLIHGLGDEADSWRHLIPLLNAAGCRTLAPDLPGFGRSVERRKISLKRHAAAVVRLIQAKCPADTVWLAGSSMGAMVAEEVVLRRPWLCRGIVLIDGSIPGGPPSPGVFALARLLFSRKWYRAYRNDGDGLWASLNPYYADLAALPPADRDFLRERVMARVQSAAQERAFFQSQRSVVWAYMTSSALYARKIRAWPGKILLLWGESDRLIPLSSAERFKALRNGKSANGKLAEGIDLFIIPGAGHLPHQENPGETARFIAEFVKLTNK